MSYVYVGFQSVIFLSWRSLPFAGMMSFEYRTHSKKNSLLTGAFKVGNTRKKKVGKEKYKEAKPISAFS